MPEDPAPGPEQVPVLAIVRGSASAEQIAAVVTVLAARRAAAAATAGGGEAPGYGWSARSRLLRAPLPRGHGGWRASALPR